MDDAQKIELVCKTVKELLGKMRIEGKVKAKITDQEDQELIWVNIDTIGDPRFLIGQRGSNLAALQHLVRLIVRRTLAEEKVNFILDVNKYKENRLSYLRKLAQNSAAKSAKTREAQVLEPMSSYERRVVHLALASDPEVTTESTGEGAERRVIIKPKQG